MPRIGTAKICISSVVTFKPAAQSISGIHHITAIASDPQANLDFYSGFLGLRLVKKTVNFDDPGTYHLYYGDRTGSPGSILTFFPWPRARRGRPGPGQVSSVAFSVPLGSSGYWKDRAREFSVPVQEIEAEALTLGLEDPDGLHLQLVESNVGPEGSNSIAGFHSAVLEVADEHATQELLTRDFGWTGRGSRVTAPDPSGIGKQVQLKVSADGATGRGGAGTIHHIAWRVPNADQQIAWRERLIGLGYDVTPIVDRNYFESIYFREHGGILFEIATDVPGFTVDESEEELGLNLKLPEQYEPIRERLERSLPPIRLN
ncbi:MAG TPA: ring-cleaving dioxygenase [Bryobacteraceae bacterium]|nr:ring-cleaving dioxygenase [Bryobacteraceae bacterium]